MSTKQKQQQTAKWKATEASEAAPAASAQPQPASSSTDIPAASGQTAVPTCHIIEFCCSDESELGSVAVCKGLISHRFSRSFANMSKPSGLLKAQQVIDAIPRGDIIHIWSAIPCTGWSQLVHVNVPNILFRLPLSLRS